MNDSSEQRMTRSPDQQPPTEPALPAPDAGSASSALAGVVSRLSVPVTLHRWLLPAAAMALVLGGVLLWLGWRESSADRLDHAIVEQRDRLADVLRSDVDALRVQFDATASASGCRPASGRLHRRSRRGQTAVAGAVGRRVSCSGSQYRIEHRGPSAIIRPAGPDAPGSARHRRGGACGQGAVGADAGPGASGRCRWSGARGGDRRGADRYAGSPSDRTGSGRWLPRHQAGPHPDRPAR